MKARPSYHVQASILYLLWLVSELSDYAGSLYSCHYGKYTHQEDCKVSAPAQAKRIVVKYLNLNLYEVSVIICPKI